jgi:hypothetical protein
MVDWSQWELPSEIGKKRKWNISDKVGKEEEEEVYTTRQKKEKIWAGHIFPKPPYPLPNMTESCTPLSIRQKPKIVPVDGTFYKSLYRMTETSAKLAEYLSEWAVLGCKKILATYTSWTKQIPITFPDLNVAIQALLLNWANKVMTLPQISSYDVKMILENALLQDNMIVQDGQFYYFNDEEIDPEVYHLFGSSSAQF